MALELDTRLDTVMGFKVTNEEGEEQVHVTIIPQLTGKNNPFEKGDEALPIVEAKIKEALRQVHFATAGVFELKKRFITPTTMGPVEPRYHCLVVIFKRIK